MSKENESLKVPILKKEAIVPIDISYTESGALVNALFLIAGTLSKEQMDDFKDILENKKPVTDTKMMSYIVLDSLYRKILLSGKTLDMIEYTDMVVNNPLKDTAVITE